MLGWECPRCGTCFAPTVEECKHCFSHVAVPDTSTTCCGDNCVCICPECCCLRLAVPKVPLTYYHNRSWSCPACELTNTTLCPSFGMGVVTLTPGAVITLTPGATITCK